MKQCTVDGCDKTARARGWCSMHYERWRKHGDPGSSKAMRPRRYEDSVLCECPGCEARPISKGFCSTHYTRVLRGQPLELRRRRPPYGISEIDYLQYHSRPTETGCIDWQGARKANGYGVWTLATRHKGHRLAHRIA